MVSLADVVATVAQQHRLESPSKSHVSSKRDSSPSISFQSTIKHPASPSSPSAHTDPPRSISFNSLPNSYIVHTVGNSGNENGIAPSSNHQIDETDIKPEPGTSQFRDALEYEDLEQRSRAREVFGRKRDSRLEESWNPFKWLSYTSKEEKQRADFDGSSLKPTETQPSDRESHTSKPQTQLQRSSSAPLFKRDQDKEIDDENDKRGGAPKWNRLRSLLPNILAQNHSISQPGTSAMTPQPVNITDELIAGGLSTLMLRLWFERDEKGHRRIPVLLHRLRVRISDSLHPLDGSKAVFRIECEYANGAARWVIYRQLREFISLHSHYVLSNAYNRNVNTLPEFPLTSLPYLKFLKKEYKENGNQVGHADFARMQREALENYLVGLIRAVMFNPTLNRLAGFLEISALFIALAQSGGAQYKAGYLRLQASGSKGGGFGPKSATRTSKRTHKWCAVRESYLVVVEELAELTVFDVFLIDSSFKIERPTRYYRQGLHLLHADSGTGNYDEKRKGKEKEKFDPESKDTDCVSTLGSLRTKISNVFRTNEKKSSSIKERVRMPDEQADSDDSNLPSSSSPTRPPTPLLDPSTNTNPLLDTDEPNERDPEKKQKKRRDDEVSKHTFYIKNAQMRLKLFARNERQMLQWIAALDKVKATSHYSRENRFDSFAPIRLNVAAQWLVDGRDYFWNLSRAILLAKKSIYIHDWWISPELRMRRPQKERYRLDRLLQQKAQEGVKIYIILYHEVSSRTTPTDSNYTKHKLMGLHTENIMVQRSPSHFQTGTFYWAHHEKFCVIDQAIAFTGGVDLCFGRWDTPQHVLVDDTSNEFHELSEQIWHGKDYSNARVCDFHTLTKPEEEMYDRSKVPRMPWHDVGLQVVGQPARDIARHFVERWNYLLRIKNHSRIMPCLLPPPEFKPVELAAMGLTGTCEMQICRSAGPWSLGTQDRIEHSIQNAYLKAIQLSEHFVYIENQFFITSTVVGDVKIENRIGDAIVHRIIRAHREGTPWKCCILIPTLPGFPFPLDHGDASSIRIIMECQNRTICRGPNSIFGRLRKEGIDPDDHISIFSLRNWGKLRGNVLTTEQVYIHGKVCIVDDRLAIIGSANINERSQRGDRDSEIAAVIRDTDMIDGYMAGKPFKVGRFAHTLRVRLMREHLGVDVDGMYEEDLMAANPEYAACDVQDPVNEQNYHGSKSVVTNIHPHKEAVKNLAKTTASRIVFHEMRDIIAGDEGKLGEVGIKNENFDATAGDESLTEERTTFSGDGSKHFGSASAIVPTLEEKIIAEGFSSGSTTEKPVDEEQESQRTLEKDQARSGDLYGAPADASRDVTTDEQPPHAVSGVNDADEKEEKASGARAHIRKHLNASFGSKPWTLPTPTPHVDPHGFSDPISDAFWKNTWVACAVHNTEIYRKVFHAVPDDLVATWKQYKEFILHHERLNKPTEDACPGPRSAPETDDEETEGSNTSFNMDSSNSETSKVKGTDENVNDKPTSAVDRSKKGSIAEEPFEKWERDEMEKLLGELRGHLVVYPTRFLEAEDKANNFLFNTDRLLPLLIYS